MNITSWELYWILKLDDMRSILGAAVFLGVALIVPAVPAIMSVEASDLRSGRGKLVCICTAVLASITFISALGAIFIPSTAQMAAIKLVPTITNTEFAKKELPEEAAELYGLLKQYLKENINNGVEK